MKPRKPKTCKVCEKQFTPSLSTQKVCSPSCAIVFAGNQRQAKEAKARNKALREGREALKSKSDHLREAQTVFNRFIRLRDKDLPCISCQRHHTGQYHAGHYRSVGSAPQSLRFCEDNVAKQCQPCNTHLSSNAINYRINLIKKIGLERVEWLEGPHELVKWSIDDIKEIKATYRQKIKELEREN